MGCDFHRDRYRFYGCKPSHKHPRELAVSSPSTSSYAFLELGHTRQRIGGSYCLIQLTGTKAFLHHGLHHVNHLSNNNLAVMVHIINDNLTCFCEIVLSLAFSDTPFICSMRI
ncbi:hypothetical protein [Prochlorococcus marinus]|uniref:hypothetical protein n=1 Tax=Prochlorococcus sp. MIT 1342 TaxID=3082532 RepID=UPI0018C86612